MLPNVFKDWIIFRPKSKEDIKKELQEYLKIGYTKEEYFKYVKSYCEAIGILDELKNV